MRFVRLFGRAFRRSRRAFLLFSPRSVENHLYDFINFANPSKAAPPYRYSISFIFISHRISSVIAPDLREIAVAILITLE